MQGFIVYRASCRSFVARIGSLGVVPMEAGVPVHPSLKGSYRVTLLGGAGTVCQPVWQGLQDILEEFDPDATHVFTGIHKEQVMAAAHLMAENRPLSYYTYNGIE